MDCCVFRGCESGTSIVKQRPALHQQYNRFLPTAQVAISLLFEPLLLPRHAGRADLLAIHTDEYHVDTRIERATLRPPASVRLEYAEVIRKWHFNLYHVNHLPCHAAL